MIKTADGQSHAAGQVIDCPVAHPTKVKTRNRACVSGSIIPARKRGPPITVSLFGLPWKGPNEPLIAGTHPQCEHNKMADEEHFIDSEADESEDDKSPADSDSSSEEEEEEEEDYRAEGQSKDMESFINDESDEGEGEGPVAEGEVVNEGEGEEEDVESDDKVESKRRKRGMGAGL